MLNRREFLKTAAGTGVAAALISNASFPSVMAAEPQKEPDKSAQMKESYAFFSACCLHPDKANADFIIAEPAKSIADKVELIHAKARQLDAPLLSTTCLGILRNNPAMSVRDTVNKLRAQTKGKPKMVFVPLDATEQEVQDAISCRVIYLERHGYKTAQENVKETAGNVFLHNLHASKIVKALEPRHWIVFGRGFQTCSSLAAVSLLAMDQRVTVIEDAILPSGGEWNTPGSFQRNVDYLKSLGARFTSFDSVWNEKS